MYDLHQLSKKEVQAVKEQPSHSERESGARDIISVLRGKEMPTARS